MCVCVCEREREKDFVCVCEPLNPFSSLTHIHIYIYVYYIHKFKLTCFDVGKHLMCVTQLALGGDDERPIRAAGAVSARGVQRRRSDAVSHAVSVQRAAGPARRAGLERSDADRETRSLRHGQSPAVQRVRPHTTTGEHTLPQENTHTCALVTKHLQLRTRRPYQ